jgi:pimeloyl-ACP methyl ester carboxylesterase
MTIRIRTEDDCVLCAEHWGREPAEILLIHGLGDGRFIWKDFATRLHPFGCVAVDLRGHGDSGWDSAGAYDIDTYATDVEQVVRALNLQRAVVVGHSLGAAVAIRVAMRAPSLRGMVLVDGGPDLSRHGLMHIRDQFRAQPWCYADVTEYLGALEQRLPLASFETLRQCATDALHLLPATGARLKCDPALARIGERQEGPDLWGMLRTIQCPVLVVRGERSAILTRSTAEKMQRELRMVSLQTVSRAGHTVMLENAEGFVEVVRSFLISIERVTPPRGPLP